MTPDATLSHASPTFFYADEDIVVMATEEEATPDDLAWLVEDGEEIAAAPVVHAPVSAPRTTATARPWSDVRFLVVCTAAWAVAAGSVLALVD